MSNNDLTPILWREFKRQIHLKYILIFQIAVTILFLYTRISDFNISSFWIYVPLAFTFITQNDIFFYDLTTYIETLLSTPLSINKVLKAKSIFILIKSYLFSVVLFVVYILFIQTNNLINYQIKTDEVLVMLLFIVMQYYLSVFLGELVWYLGKKSRVWVVITQTIVILTVNNFLKEDKTRIMLCLTIVLTIVFCFLGIILTKFITKERLIERSL